MSNVDNVYQRVPYFYRYYNNSNDGTNNISTDNDDGLPSVCTYELPVELGLDVLQNDKSSTLILHYSRLVLRSFVRKPSLITSTSRQSNFSLALFDTFDPIVNNFDIAVNNNDDDDDDNDNDNNSGGITYLLSLLSDRANASRTFVQVLYVWYNCFYVHRHSVNWMRFYETGDLKLTGAAASMLATTTITATTETAVTLDRNFSAGNCTDKFNNDELFRAYERFIVKLREILNNLRKRMIIRFGRLLACNRLKSDFTVNDTRLISLLLYDLVDLLECYVTRVPCFQVDRKTFVRQYKQTRRALIFARTEQIRRLCTVHAGFSTMKDWLYFRDVTLFPLETRFRQYEKFAKKCEPLHDQTEIKRTLNDLTVYTVHETNVSLIVLTLHDLVVRYLLRKYFRKNVKFGDNIDPYSHGEVNLDLDLMNFFVFMVNRCLGETGNFDYANSREIVHSHAFWYKTLAHCAIIAPQTFVAQVYTFIAPLYRGAREIRLHDVIDYVTWLCVDDPWYMVYSSSSIERLRTIEEQRLRKHFDALYDYECILFYVFIENIFPSKAEKMYYIQNHAAVFSHNEQFADRESHRSDDVPSNDGSDRNENRCGTTNRTIGSVDDSDRSAKRLLPCFNWKLMFETFYDQNVYDGTIAHSFRAVREFFQYIITKNIRPDMPISSEIEALLRQYRPKQQQQQQQRRQRNANDEDVNDNGAEDNERDDVVAYSFQIVWKKANAKTNSVYIEIMQRLMNFMNSVCVMFNGVLANTGSADFMRPFGVRQMQALLKKEQAIWNKDKVLCVYGEIFKDFDLDDFENACRRAKLSSLPSTMIGNCLSNVSSVNTNFLRIASNGRQQYVIWNLTTRAYEPAAPSLLYLLTLDTSNWYTTNDENFPSKPDPTISEYVSTVLGNLDDFIGDVQRVDALSMMLYTRLIQKKRIGDSLDGAFANENTDFMDRVVRSMMNNNDSSNGNNTLDNNGDNEQSHHQQSRSALDDFNLFVIDEDDAPLERSVRYVDFIIDKDEFFRLSKHVPIEWIDRFIAHTLSNYGKSYNKTANSNDIDDEYSTLDDIDIDRKTDILFVQLLLLLLQLSRDSRFSTFLSRDGFINNLSNELLESAIATEWLRKRVKEYQSSVFETKRQRLQGRGREIAEQLVDDNNADNDDDDSREIDDIPFGRLVDRQLSTVDLTIFADDKDREDESFVSLKRVANRVIDMTIVEDNGGNDETFTSGLWELTIDNGGAHATRMKTFGDSNNIFLQGLIVEREFRERIKRLLRDRHFYRWTLDVMSEINIEHVHQLDDRIIHAAFCAYAYVVRFCADLPKSNNAPTNAPTNNTVNNNTVNNNTVNNNTMNNDRTAKSSTTTVSKSQVNVSTDNDIVVASSSLSSSLSSLNDAIGVRLKCNATVLLTKLQNFFPCVFVVNTKTMDISNAMTMWLETRLSAGKRSMNVRFATPAVPAINDTIIDNNDANDEYDHLGDTFFDFDNLLNSINSVVFSACAANSRQRLGSTRDAASQQQQQQQSASVVALDRTNNHRIQPLYTLYDCVSLPRALRESIVYFCLVVHIFCDLDVSVSTYMLRLIVSFLYPGVESRHCVIVRGSSGSGKSQFFDYIREFFNSGNGIFTTQALSSGSNLINTQLIPIGQNFICQCDEPKRVDNETLKLMISSVPIAARSFQNQATQTIPILAKLVMTVNNMFQIESDDGILERLHSVFRLSHKHYNLVHEQTDMTRYNCGSSWNIAHQFTDRVFPRDVDKAMFSRGMFHILHHWSTDQTVRPNVSYTIADHYAAMMLHTLCNFDYEDDVRVSDDVDMIAHWDVYETRLGLGRRTFEQVIRHDPLYNYVALLENVRDKIGRMMFVLNQRNENVLPRVSSCAESLFECTNSSCTVDIAKNTVLRADTLCELFRSNARRSLFRFVWTRVNSDFDTIVTDEARVEIFKRLGLYRSRDHLLCMFMPDECAATLDLRFPSLIASYRSRRLHGHANFDKLYFTYNSGFDGDRNVDVSVLPCTLDLNLVDLQASLDPFVRFKRMFIVDYSNVPISREALRKKLNSYVDEINMTIEEAKYRIKYKDFHDRFETEYGKWRYKRPNSNEIVSNLWCVRIRKI